MKRGLQLLTLAILVFAGCNQISLDESSTIEKGSKQEDLRILPGDASITPEEAINVAFLFDKNQGRAQTKAQNGSADVYTVHNEEGMPAFHAVNRADNAGFVIVGASRKYYPILAYAEKGHFGEDYSDYGLSSWVEQQQIVISAAENGELITPEINYQALWYDYETHLPLQLIETKSEAEAFALRQASVSAWEQQGYTCYALQDQPSEMPSSMYNTFCSVASGLANPDYNYALYSVILERPITNTSSTGVLMGSTWDQCNGYNIYALNASNDTVALGWLPVALGQMMRYYQKPLDYSWSSMYLNSPTNYTANFLKKIGSHAGLDYLNSNPAGNDSTARSVLSSYYGYQTSFGNYSRQSLIEDLEDDNPVILFDSVHRQMWVCEGHKLTTLHYEYTLMVLSITAPLTYEYGTSGAAPEFSPIHYFYHNFGRGGSCNGWYVGDNASNSLGLFNPVRMIYEITPPTGYFNGL